MTPGDSVIVVKEPDVPIVLGPHVEVILGLQGSAVKAVGDSWVVDFYAFGCTVVPADLLALSNHVLRP